ncbi:citronellyl-CoA dehydrogenase [Saccharopolyspora antimicrobica]|uniref:Citronellyl-CoA dehydrogenase n=1 Tax=Saccharopolyspora antimicrobica TaxID=455193 RepID=A0A1I5FKD3_9PSEU|nr:acyl-CoA dehydrogenase [Saccharopolyspora antimicrobica]RKT82198.1 citronellyl-CoA dehydrogenase [Saccharopolyspora antimicrobica]SFO24076.1 citronellyl-CoA dehydrogenase [Saccharopolyspora antimicrobica]
MPEAALSPEPMVELPGFDALEKVLDELAPAASAREIWAALGQTGLIEQVYRHGSPGAGVIPARLARVLAAVDARFPVGTTLSVCVQLATVLPLLAGDDGRPAQTLRRALGGAAIVGLAATDVGSGSDLTALETEVALGEREIVLHGTKRWITNAVTADEFLVLARHRSGRHFTNFTWVLVPAGTPGVSVRAADSDLFHGSGVGDVTFDDVRLERSCVVGRPGRGLASFARHIATERLAGALWALALCRRTLEHTLRGLSVRSHQQGTLWDLDSVRQRFAACLVDLRQLDALARELSGRIASRFDTSAAALLKAAVGTTVDRVLAECAQLQGAEGFTSTGAQRLRAQAAIFGIGGGTTEVVRSAVADDAVVVLAELDPSDWPCTAG